MPAEHLQAAQEALANELTRTRSQATLRTRTLRDENERLKVELATQRERAVPAPSVVLVLLLQCLGGCLLSTCVPALFDSVQVYWYDIEKLHGPCPWCCVDAVAVQCTGTCAEHMCVPASCDTYGTGII